MPWFCLPHRFAGRDKLLKHFHAQGIPHLVVLDPSGNVLTYDGTSHVELDPTGSEFPWHPKRLSQILPQRILTKVGTLPMSALRDRYIILYFSANWCPPCRSFTPILSQAYTDLIQQRSDFELIFVSSDRDYETFRDYYEEMSFCAIPYQDMVARNGLAKRFEVKGVPSLLILSPQSVGGERTLINADIRDQIENGELHDFPFYPKAYGDLARAGDTINRKRCLILFHEGGDDEEQQEAVGVVKQVASQYRGTDMMFYWSLDVAGLGSRVRNAVKMSQISDAPACIILDIPDRGGFYVSQNKDISFEAISGFVQNPGCRLQLDR
eukprot:CAMPEP_0118700232 /NCGR_PEP_ID=MMETSP0800-20121206/16440_1 /TAXON_ID=210618 ORGANISM="Striatella unipunctata, Strain CCMP2910" /NCGR_SAMPLE_ID=MMETSP0800 /ASSEMBLY_ACC=CAM_ASM_000638 /LENGTH=323 /DNA_ID=CAMNT_0006600737 /DNA_START=304 /DNA_END=1275 /DNA_ORIENTATION=+